MSTVHVVDESFIVAAPAAIAAFLGDERCWSTWFPEIRLHCVEDRAGLGKRWAVTGAWQGSAEVWVEQFGDGAIVHVFLRAHDVHRRWWPRYARRLRRHMFTVKDELEGLREPGCGRVATCQRVVSLSPTAAVEREGEVAEQTSSRIVIAAPPDAVMAVIADFDAYPEWAKGVKQTEVLSDYDDGRAGEVRFVLDAAPIKDEYTLRYEWDGDKQVTWKLVEARMLRAMEGAYVLTSQGDQTDVRYELAVDLSIPMIGLLKRKAEKVVVDTALKGLKKRVESAG